MSKNWTSDLSSDLSFTFYPVWREKQVTIKYDLNGGTGTISPTYKKLDIECTLSTTKPTKTDYTFAGWSADKIPQSHNISQERNIRAIKM